jgi:hypothetical protein
MNNDLEILTIINYFMKATNKLFDDLSEKGIENTVYGKIWYLWKHISFLFVKKQFAEIIWHKLLQPHVAESKVLLLFHIT